MSDSVDTVQRTAARARLRLSSVALAAAFLFAVAGLVAADRAVASSRRWRVQTGASEAAAYIEGFLQLHGQALQGLRNLPVDSVHARRIDARREFDQLTRVALRHAPAFRHIALTDAEGVVRFERRIGENEPALASRLDIDTLRHLGVAALARRGRTTDLTLISRPGTIFSGERGLVLVQPLWSGRRLTGFAVGTMAAGAVLATVHDHSPLRNVRHIVLAGDDTIAADALPADAIHESGTAVVNTPDGGQWRVVVEGSAAAWVRLLMWSVGLVMLGALFVALVHERRQGLRLAERSAELERLSMELLRANRAKSEFLNSISHELRTPLNAIVGFAEMLRDGVYGDLAPRQASPVGRIASSATHLRHLVDQVLDLAKMTAGRLEVHSEPVDLRTMAIDVASEVEPLAERQSLTLSITVGATLPRVRTDPGHLRRIVLNLVSNAIKYTKTGGIAIRARVATDVDLPAALAPANRRGAPRQWIAFSVSDTGIGVARTDFERIFDEFEQVNAGSRGASMQRGTGLGLPISRRLARLLGGEITIESELGKGSTFVVWLPVDVADVRTGNTAEFRVPAGVGSSG